MRSNDAVPDSVPIHDLDPWLFQFGTSGIGVRWYGLAYVGGFVVAYQLLRLLARRQIGPLREGELADFITMVALFGVLLGGRLGYMLFYDLGGFLREPWRIVQVWDGGMASHGGIAGVTLFVWFYARKHGYSWSAIGDNLVCVAPVGVFFGRIANFINGELYGKPADPARVPWAMRFPDEILAEPDVADAVFRQLPGMTFEQIKGALHDPAVREVLGSALTPRHPSQIYQALLEGLLLFGILFGLRWKFPRLPDGLLTGLFFLLYALFRILGETWRHADSGYIGPLQKGQFYSLFMFAAAAGFFWHAYRGWRASGAGPRAPLKAS